MTRVLAAAVQRLPRTSRGPALRKLLNGRADARHASSSGRSYDRCVPMAGWHPADERGRFSHPEFIDCSVIPSRLCPRTHCPNVQVGIPTRTTSRCSGSSTDHGGRRRLCLSWEPDPDQVSNATGRCTHPNSSVGRSGRTSFHRGIPSRTARLNIGGIGAGIGRLNTKRIGVSIAEGPADCRPGGRDQRPRNRSFHGIQIPVRVGIWSGRDIRRARCAESQDIWELVSSAEVWEASHRSAMTRTGILIRRSGASRGSG